MEINNLFIKRTIISEVHFFTLSIAIWLLLFSPFDTTSRALTFSQLIFVAGAGLGSLALFKAFESISTICVLPIHSYVFIMTMAFLIGSVMSNILLSLWYSQGLYETLDIIILKGAPLALVVFGIYVLCTVFLLRYERKRNVVLDITPRQRSILLEDLSPFRLESHLSYLTKTELQQYMERGAIHDVDLIIISREAVVDFDTDAVLLRAHLAGIPIIDLRSITTKITGRVRLNETDLACYLLEATQKTFLRRALLRIKYLIEPVIAFLMTLLFLPLFFIIAIIIKRFSPGPVFYHQTRTGYLGKQFKLIKFRTMRIDAERNGPQWASPKDSRITPIGHFLRRTRLDELPQLWNVMRGEMSFVGPRPERPEIYKHLESDVPLFSLRTLVRPGISGWAQVCAGYAASSAESHLKLEYDLFYIQHMSLRFDLYIIIKTLKTAFVGDRAARKSISIDAPPVVMQT